MIREKANRRADVEQRQIRYWTNQQHFAAEWTGSVLSAKVGRNSENIRRPPGCLDRIIIYGQ